MGSFGALPTLGRGSGAALKDLYWGLGSVVLYFWTAREPRGCSAGRSARGESLDVSEATYETRGSDPTVL